jgi:hypothetical protein
LAEPSGKAHVFSAKKEKISTLSCNPAVLGCMETSFISIWAGEAASVGTQ